MLSIIEIPKSNLTKTQIQDSNYIFQELWEAVRTDSELSDMQGKMLNVKPLNFFKFAGAITLPAIVAAGVCLYGPDYVGEKVSIVTSLAIVFFSANKTHHWLEENNREYLGLSKAYDQRSADITLKKEEALKRDEPTKWANYELANESSIHGL